MIDSEKPVGCLKKLNMGQCPKRWEGVPTGSQIFQNVQLGHRREEGGGPDDHVPNAAHIFFIVEKEIDNKIEDENTQCFSPQLNLIFISRIQYLHSTFDCCDLS